MSRTGTPRRDLLTFMAKIEGARSHLSFVHDLLGEAIALADDEPPLDQLVRMAADVDRMQSKLAELERCCVDELPSLDAVTEKARATLERLAARSVGPFCKCAPPCSCPKGARS